MRRYFLIAVIALAFVCPSAYSQIIVYDNTTNFSGQAFSPAGAGLEGANTITRLSADRIALIPGGGGQNATQWTFSVTNLNAVAVSARPRVRFWDDDGAGGAPGTLITGFSFAAISFPATSVQLFNSTAAFPLPADGTFWAGITFDNNSGATGATAAQLDLLGQGIFDPPTVGSSADDFFLTTALGSNFISNPPGTIQNFGGLPIANFAWQFQVAAIPEPTSMALMSVAAIGGLWRLRRKRA